MGAGAFFRVFVKSEAAPAPPPLSEEEVEEERAVEAAQELVEKVHEWSSDRLNELRDCIREALEAVDKADRLGADGHARGLEWKVIHYGWMALEKLVPELDEEEGIATPSVTFSSVGHFKSITIANETQDIIAQLLARASELQSMGDAGRSAGVIVRLARLETRLVLTAIAEGLNSRNKPALRLATDRLSNVIEVGGIEGLRRPLIARLSSGEIRAFIESCDPFSGGADSQTSFISLESPFLDLVDDEDEYQQWLFLAELCNLFDIASNMATERPSTAEESEDPDSQEPEMQEPEEAEGDVDPAMIDMEGAFAFGHGQSSASADEGQPMGFLQVHASAVQRCALRKLRKVFQKNDALARGSDAALREELVDAALVALHDLQRAGSMWALMPLDALAASTCASWLQTTIRRPPGGCLSRSEITAILALQQIALAVAPYLRDLDVVTPLLAAVVEELEVAVKDEDWRRLADSIRLVQGLEVNVREMLGAINARKLTQWVGKLQLAHWAGGPLLEMATSDLLGASALARTPAADEALYDDAFNVSEDGSDTMSLTLRCRISKERFAFRCSCGTSVLFYACAMRGLYELSSRICPNCGRQLSQPCDGAARSASRNLEAAARETLPQEAWALQLYKLVCSAAAVSVEAELKRSASGRAEARLGGEGESPMRARELTPYHQGFQKAVVEHLSLLRERSSAAEAAQDVTCTTAAKQAFLFGAYALVCGVTVDLGCSLKQLQDACPPDVHQVLSHPGVRSSLEDAQLRQHELQAWVDDVESALETDDVSGLYSSLAWAACNPVSQGTSAYQAALTAYRARKMLPDTWSLQEVLFETAAAEPWRDCMVSVMEAIDLCTSPGDADLELKELLLQAIEKPHLQELVTCWLGKETYCDMKQLPSTWSLPEVMSRADAVLAWRHRAAHSSAEDLDEFRRMLQEARREGEQGYLQDLAEFDDYVET
eukprot:TRINITY_DN11330_c0_g1_i1.p1 TRINITY_DN11330_c0_g1~~TRINITY_DN11330_c0_g1_i1.p1  ORF type:complete len:952 (-),score=228.17 TRINITY_DN11330_c0_g1_i1:215-3070(-)